MKYVKIYYIQRIPSPVSQGSQHHDSELYYIHLSFTSERMNGVKVFIQHVK